MNAKQLLFGLLGFIVFVVVATFLWGMGINNRLVTLNETVQSAWAQVQNQYQRRADLIPNLVETVKGYASHERQTLEAVVSARSKVGQLNVSPELLNNPKALAQFDKMQGELSSALTRLMAVAENYPQLKANENFLQLQAQLEGTENRISVERRRFNEMVQEYNVSMKKFPGNFLAGMLGFTQKEYFEAVPGSDKPPTVNFKVPKV